MQGASTVLYLMPCCRYSLKQGLSVAAQADVVSNSLSKVEPS